MKRMMRQSRALRLSPRNQPRKKIDICAKAFGVFAADKDDVRYYHHAGVEDSGWNIIELAKRYDFDKKLILSSKDLSPQKYVPDKTLNLIYNSADVGLNLSWGEGFGLCFAPGTKIYTPDKLKAIEDIQVGSEVFDADGRITTVVNTLERDYTGDIYKIKLSGLADFIYVTGEHPFLTMDGWVKAKDLEVYETHVFKPDLTVNSVMSVDLSNYGSFIHDDKYIYLYKSCLGTSVTLKELEYARVLYNSDVKRSSITKIPRYIKLDMRLVPVFAPIFSKRSLTKVPRLIMPQVMELLGTTRKVSKVSETDMQVAEAFTRVAFRQDTYLHMDKKCLLKLFHTFVMARNYTHPVRSCVVISTKSPRIKELYRVILHTLGVASSEYYNCDDTIYISIDKKFLPIYSKSFTVKSRIADINGYYYRVVKVEKVPYSGKVYNLETKSHTYNVMGYAVHNCNMEHAITGKPQIVAANSANLELYADGRGILVPISHYDTNPTILTEAAVVSVRRSVEALEYAYNNREEIKNIGLKSREYFLQDQFKWENIADTFREIIET